MSWREERGPTQRPPPHCTLCDDSGRVFSDPDGDWVDCQCRQRVPVVTRVTVTDDEP